MHKRNTVRNVFTRWAKDPRPSRNSLPITIPRQTLYSVTNKREQHHCNLTNNRQRYQNKYDYTHICVYIYIYVWASVLTKLAGEREIKFSQEAALSRKLGTSLTGRNSPARCQEHRCHCTQLTYVTTAVLTLWPWHKLDVFGPRPD